MLNKQIKENINTILLILAPILIVLFFIFCAQCRFYFFENYIRVALSIFVFSFAGYFIKDNVWESELPNLSFWIFYFILLGFIFSSFLEPNIFRFIYYIYKKTITMEYLSNFVFSLIAWCGWIISFFYLSNIKFGKKLKNRKYEIHNYFAWVFMYLIYLNITISVIHRFFKKSF